MALTYPGIDPVALSLGPVQVRWYGLAYVAGFVGSLLALRKLNERWELGLSFDDMLEIILAAVVGVVVGGRLGYTLVYSSGQWLHDPLYVFRMWEGGMSFHGGLVGIMLAAIV
ncbi:MAG: prolipoprotein diacylglyceryl transferase, partial [Actinobacteria bacterium]